MPWPHRVCMSWRTGTETACVPNVVPTQQKGPTPEPKGGASASASVAQGKRASRIQDRVRRSGVRPVA
jgi:hypothetical protein